jgi:hypothetical protein
VNDEFKRGHVDEVGCTTYREGCAEPGWSQDALRYLPLFDTGSEYQQWRVTRRDEGIEDGFVGIDDRDLHCGHSDGDGEWRGKED